MLTNNYYANIVNLCSIYYIVNLCSI